MRRPLTTLGAAVLLVLAIAAGTATATSASSREIASVATPRCHTSELSGRFGFIQGAAGSRFGPLILTNRSHHTCTLRGYIGAQLRGVAGRRLHTVIVRDHSRTPHSVSLPPGRSAATEIRWSAIPVAGETCPLPHAIDVTPPDETTQLRLHWTSSRVCGAGHIDVRPLVAH